MQLGVFHIGWPQGIFLALILLSDLGALVNHGKPRNSNWDFNVSFAGTLVTLILLYWGGFFS